MKLYLSRGIYYTNVIANRNGCTERSGYADNYEMFTPFGVLKISMNVFENRLSVSFCGFVNEKPN